MHLKSNKFIEEDYSLKMTKVSFINHSLVFLCQGSYNFCSTSFLESDRSHVHRFIMRKGPREEMEKHAVPVWSVPPVFPQFRHQPGEFLPFSIHFLLTTLRMMVMKSLFEELLLGRLVRHGRFSLETSRLSASRECLATRLHRSTR